MNSVDRSGIAFEILSYLAENPEAKDTVEGIAHWWLLDRKISHEIARVQEALLELAEEGFILAHTGADAQTHWKINRDKYAAIQALLQQRSH